MLIENIKKLQNIDDIALIVEKVIDINIYSSTLGASKNNALILLKNFLYNELSRQKNSLSVKQSTKINIKRVLEKQYCSKTKLWKIFKDAPFINRNVGTVPLIFIDNAYNKKEVVVKLYDLFAKYSQILNYDYSHEIEFIKVEIPIFTQNFADEIKNLIKKDVEVSYVGHGFFGNGYRIRVFDENGEKSFFYKAFYPSSVRHHHGMDVEAAYALFTKKNARKRQFVKFFMGRLASPYEKDAFLLTEFLQAKNNDIQQSQQLFIDYIFAKDVKVENAIGGKVIDFGDVRERNPELSDRKLRRMIRVITMRIKKHVDKKTICYNWEINNKNCRILKKYVEKCDRELYLKAVDIIHEKIPMLPYKMLSDLKKIDKWSDAKTINYRNSLHASDLFVHDISTLKKNIKTLNLKIKSSLDGSEEMFGYIIIDLFFDRQAVYILDKDNNITDIRIEKLVDNQFKTLLELNGEQIDSYKNDDISKLICS